MSWMFNYLNLNDCFGFCIQDTAFRNKSRLKQHWQVLTVPIVEAT